MNTQENPNKSGTLLLVGMLAVIALGVVGALIYNQQLNVYQNRAAERNQNATMPKTGDNNGQSFNNGKDAMVVDDSALPPDPNDPTSVSNEAEGTTFQMPTSERPDMFNKGYSNKVRMDL